MSEHPRCTWSACDRLAGRGIVYWGSFHWLCSEHADMIGPDDAAITEANRYDAEQAERRAERLVGM